MFAAVALRLIVVGMAVAVAAGCTGEPAAVGRGAAAGTPTPTSSPDAPSRLVQGCRVTVPHPVPSSEEWKGALFGYERAYGNGKLWVGALGDGGVIDDFAEPDGSIGRKLGWWRAVPGTLRITGRRLDDAAPPLRAEVPPGYGESGFQASGVYFPTPGCWEVTGTVGTTNLSFVTLVIKAG
jgi:hypothetical protein